MKSRKQLKFLLLQIRDDQETMLEEYLEFIEFGDLHESQLDVLNTFRTARFKPDYVDQYDGLFVGGSSDATVLDTHSYPFVNNCKKMLRYCYNKNIPVFASCFGFQLAVEEFGGTIILDEKNKEAGIYSITLTNAAKQDKLLHDIPTVFKAAIGHKERAMTLPDDIELLAFSEKCPYHLFKLNNKDFYAFQFHPEVSGKDLIARMTRYRERYLENEAELQKVIDSAQQDTSISNSLIAKFIDRIVLAKNMTANKYGWNQA